MEFSGSIAACSLQAGLMVGSKFDLNVVLTDMRNLYSLSTALTFEVVVCPTEPGAPADTAETIYTPLVNIEPVPRQEFLDELNWLASPFSFERNQLHMLGKSLLRLSKDEEEEEEQESDDDEVQMIED